MDVGRDTPVFGPSGLSPDGGVGLGDDRVTVEGLEGICEAKATGEEIRPGESSFNFAFFCLGSLKSVFLGSEADCSLEYFRSGG